MPPEISIQIRSVISRPAVGVLVSKLARKHRQGSVSMSRLGDKHRYEMLLFWHLLVESLNSLPSGTPIFLPWLGVDVFDIPFA